LAVWGCSVVGLAALWTLALPDWTLGAGGEMEILGRPLKTPLTQWVFYIFPPMRLFEFALGMYLASLGGRVGMKAELGAIALAAVSLAALPIFPPAFAATIFFIPASTALVYVFSRSEGPISRLLSNKGLVLLGNASFALYMIHYPLAAYLGSSVYVAALSVVMSVAVFLWFEKPAQKWLLNLQFAQQFRTTKEASC
jgi:peptidoglycan/LPS O-acetylase OafA/YrhL